MFGRFKTPEQWYDITNPGLYDVRERFVGARRDARVIVDTLPTPDYVDRTQLLINLPAVFAIARLGHFETVTITGSDTTPLTATTGSRTLRRISDLITKEELPFLGGTFHLSPSSLGGGYDLCVDVNTGLIELYAQGDSGAWIGALDASVRTILEQHSMQIVTANKGKLKVVERWSESKGFGKVALANILFVPEKA